MNKEKRNVGIYLLILCVILIGVDLSVSVYNTRWYFNFGPGAIILLTWFLYKC